ncbi:NAD(P)-binding domain-containing protein [Laribacter hongkongensis]|nr:NAD(P)-binding domain-containing protein [Laribacter hongkongensis]MCG9059690.1 NAD(P)-binding domain-containing protein [Laribacter hongkongensis]MCG9085720.1 NAD(P)-binding domain-containing protein [Laribacter hongkongensis]
MAQMKVGYIGLGIMGRPCAENLLKAGLELVVWARRPESCTPLLAAGATLATSPADLARQVDVVVTNVSDTPDVEAVVTGEDGVLAGARPGLTVIDMSTISPLGARAIAASCEEKGVFFLDSPVSGGEVGAIAGTLSFMVGGDAGAFERAQPVYRAMGKNIVRIGDSGAGSVAKSCNQIVVALNVQAVAEAFKLASACGVDKARVREALLGGFAASRVLELHGQRMIDDNYAPGFKARLHNKDMGIVNATAAALETSLPATREVSTLIARLVESGEGELDSSAIARLIAAA